MPGGRWKTGSGFPDGSSQESRLGPGHTHLSRAFTGSADSLSRWQDKGRAYFCLEPCSPGLKAFPSPTTCFEHPGGVKDRKTRALRCRPLLLPKAGDWGARGQPAYGEEGVPPAHLYPPGDDPWLVAHSPEGAAQRHGARLPKAARSQSEQGRWGPSRRHPAFPLSHFLASQSSCHVLVVRRAGLTAMGETCPSSRCKPGWPGGPHPGLPPLLPLPLSRAVVRATFTGGLINTLSLVLVHGMSFNSYKWSIFSSSYIVGSWCLERLNNLPDVT